MRTGMIERMVEPLRDRVSVETVIPYIAGDGVGPEVGDAMRQVIDTLLEQLYAGKIRFTWLPLLAGETAFKLTGSWLPEETVKAIETHGIGIKGPLATPTGGEERSLNLLLRRHLDLYQCVRPVRWFQGTPSPVVAPENVDVVIFRENTEDVYSGIDLAPGSPEQHDLSAFLRTRLGVSLPERCGLGVKPMSEAACKRLVRAAFRYAERHKRKGVTLVHKGNVMKHTEGAFCRWGYEVAAEEFPTIPVKDVIADNMFQQILLHPEDFDVIATTNLNGDYLSDAVAAQVGGLGIAPGANIGDRCALFEAAHGTAPQIAGMDEANPLGMILSAGMMLRHLDLGDAAVALEKAVSATLQRGLMTRDLAGLGTRLPGMQTSEFADHLCAEITSQAIASRVLPRVPGASHHGFPQNSAASHRRDLAAALQDSTEEFRSPLQ